MTVFCFASRRRHTICALVTGVQTCTLPICELPDFRADTRAIRDGNWQVAPTPDALLDRRVEITGPVEPKMVINALNSGARVYMADFEDSTAPAWHTLISEIGSASCRERVCQYV